MLDTALRSPNPARRYTAAVIDSVFLVVLFVSSGAFLNGMHVDLPAFACFVLVAIVYEPALTVLACTPGQAAMRFRVRRSDRASRISFWQGIVRVACKYVLGIFSFFSMMLRGDGRAIHDLLAGTVLIEAAEARRVALQSPV